MTFFNYLFYFILFLGFFLPTNDSYYLSFLGVLLRINEIAFLLLPIINLFCYSRNGLKIEDSKLKAFFLLFFFLIFFTEFVFKIVAFDQSFGDSVKSVRLGIPLFSSLILLFTGFRANIYTVWRVILLAIGSSIVISLSSIFLELPIYYSLEGGENVLNSTSGRIMNSNASFGIVGLYLLLRDKSKWYNTGKLVKVVSILAVISLILTFNRTYLAILLLEFVFLSVFTFSKINIFKIVGIPLFLFLVILTSYNSSNIIKRQIDRRILSIIFQETTIFDLTIEDKREGIYFGVFDRISQGFWIVGMPMDIPIFQRVNHYETMDLSITDTSIVNILLRYGVGPLICLIFIFSILYKFSYSDLYKVCFMCFLFASFNIDSLFRHNSIFFVILIFMISINSKK